MATYTIIIGRLIFQQPFAVSLRLLRRLYALADCRVTPLSLSISVSTMRGNSPFEGKLGSRGEEKGERDE